MRRSASLAAAALAATLVASAAQPAAPPKLVVILVVDQMRADYVDRFRHEWTDGLDRIVTSGAWFTDAAFPYLTTVTCAGHATIATGAFPHVHGVFQNAWWDRVRGQQVTCTEDPGAAPIGYTTTNPSRDSGRKLLVPTFADALRTARHGRVVSLALKDRSAIMLAGHGGAAVTWLSNTLDGWMTSTAFSDAPVPEVKTFVDANPIDADFGKTWTRLRPESQYHEPDAGIGEVPPKGWTSVFPHALTGTANAPGAEFRAQWERSPFADAYVGRFAAALAESMRLGRQGTTDVLAVSFSSPDLIGHQFGPGSQEIHDAYLRLDVTIGELLRRLDALVGRDEYVVALASDHGVTEIPEQRAAAGLGSGRIDQRAIVEAIDTRARKEIGPGDYVQRESGNDVYFHPGMYDRVARAPAVLKQILGDVDRVPGIDRAFASGDLRDASRQPDALARAAALSYVPDRSGDLVIAPKAGWMFPPAGNATTHATANPDDQRVPIVLMGARIKPGTYAAPATPADIAPTLAALCGIELESAEGHALRVALR